MKKILILFASLTALVACQKNDVPSGMSQSSDGEIVFNLQGDGLGFDVSTKATAVTEGNLSSVYWQINTGSTVTYDSTSVASAVSSKQVFTGYYWPASSTEYTFYVANIGYNSSNKTGFVSSSHSLVDVTNDTDIVCGTTKATGSGSSPASVLVTLDHIFARTGELSYTAPSGYTVSNVSYKIKSSGSATGTAGTYVIGTGWNSTAKTALAEQVFTSDSDLYLIPGTYTISVTYTITNGKGYTNTFTKSATVTLEIGKVNAINAKIPSPDGVNEITFTVKVTEWGSKTHTPTLS